MQPSKKHLTPSFLPAQSPESVALAVWLMLAGAGTAGAQSFMVSNLNDSGPGSLRQAMVDANNYGGAGTPSITFQSALAGPINLLSALPVITQTRGLSIDGAGATITVNGGQAWGGAGDRVFFLGVNAGDGGGQAGTEGSAWSLSNLSITGGHARGGKGGEGGDGLSGGTSYAGGGAGAGLGGAVFVNAGTLTLTNVDFTGNRATGGAGGGNGGVEGATGGGGGMGGDGGDGSAYNGGGGGGFGLGANGGNGGGGSGGAGAFTGSQGGGAGAGGEAGAGGVNGGGGGGSGSNQPGGGGGVGGAAGTVSGSPGGSGKGGDGGFGGGGGAGGGNSTQIGGTGGYGGGGGGAGTGSGGGGGFGGGGGAGGAGGGAGFGGGDGAGGYGGGGGGAGLGGAIFVRQGAEVIIQNGGFSGGTVTGGAGGDGGSQSDGAAGNGIGSAMFLAGNLTYIVTTGNTVTLSDTIGGGADARISGGLTKAGPGTLVLDGINTHTGITRISEGALVVNGGTAGASPVEVNGGALRGGGTVGGAVTVNAGSTLAPGSALGTARLTLSNGLSFNGPGSELSLRLNGPAAGAEHDVADISGGVSLGGATLTLTLGYTPNPGDTFFLLVNDGSDSITGAFSGIPEGGTLTLGAHTATATYTADAASGLFTGGNDFALQILPVPEPGAAALMGLAALALAGRGRRRA